MKSMTLNVILRNMNNRWYGQSKGLVVRDGTEKGIDGGLANWVGMGAG
jgi:hypothetical protein